MGLVRCNDDVTTADSTLDHSHVHHVIVRRSTNERTDLPSLIGGHLLDVTPGHHPGQAGLAGSAPPDLGQDGSRHHRDNLLGQEADVQRPHTPFVALAGNEGAGVIGNPRH